MKPVAFVIPWFGEELKGGAEQLAWQAANRLADRGHTIEVLTTCCRSFLEDWSTNHLPKGVEKKGNLTIRRFKVDRRKADTFNSANTHLLHAQPESLLPGISPCSLGTGDIFVTENINSLALEKYLKRKKNKYDSFVFLPYLYGPILNGLEHVADKAWLQPCLHDEVYAYLPHVENIFRQCKGLLYNSLGEQHLALKLFGPGVHRKGVVVGVGIENIEIDVGSLPTVVENLQLKSQKYILCLGRRDATKNSVFLAEAYARYKEQYPDSTLGLIFAGPGDGTIGEGVDGIIDLGLVSERDKNGLLAHCTALFQPSRNESYSRVIMEAWSYDRPAVAHRGCPATSMAVEAADGGWTAESREEWVALFAKVAELCEEQLVAAGKRGHLYASKYADWTAVIDNYEQSLFTQEQPVGTRHSTAIKEVHQLTPGFAVGDAISNQAILLRDRLQAMSITSKIFTEHLDPHASKEASLFHDGKGIKPTAGLIYHHSIGCGLTDFVAQHQGPKGLLYHNITPPELVEENDPGLARILQQGIDDLKVLAPHFATSAADSEFNRVDLVTDGFNDPFVLPICVTPERWNIPAETNMMARLQDGRDNILFVGRLVSNKCQHDLIEHFAAYQSLYGNGRLVLVGGYREDESYYQTLKERVEFHNLQGDVFFTGKVNDNELHACYRCAHLYWSMSEHEGFGVPLIEAMWFDVPVLAYNSSAVGETMGIGGLLFTDKNETNKLAVLAHLLMHDRELRKKVIVAQQQKRQDFLEEAIWPKLDLLLGSMYDSL